MKRNITLLFLLISQTFLLAQVWIQHGSLPTSISATSQAVFVINAKAYLYTGDSLNNFYELNGTTGLWSSRANFPGSSRNGAVGFSIGSYGYIGAGGSDSITYHDFYRYDPTSDSWQVRANFPDTTRNALSFSVNGKGYFVSGYNQDVSSTVFPNWNFVYSNKCYEYNPITNVWTQKNNVPWTPRMNGLAVTAGTKVYCGLGMQYLGGNYADWWEYNATSDTWLQRANCPTASLQHGFYNGTAICVADEVNWLLRFYNIGTNNWSSFPLYSEYCNKGKPYSGFSIGNRGYLVSNNGGGGANICSTRYDTWEFEPNKFFSLQSINGSTFCEGDTISITMNSNMVFDTANFFWLSWTPFAGNNTLQNVAGIELSASNPLSFTIPYSFISTPGPSFESGNLVLNSYLPATTTTLLTNFEVINGPTTYTPLDTVIVCEGSVYTASAGLHNGQMYEWLDATNGNTPLSNTSTVSFTPTSSTQLVLNTEMTQSGCTRLDSIYVRLSPNPTIQYADSSITLCYNQGALIGSFTPTSWSHQWNNGSSDPVIFILPQDDTWYTLTVTDTESLCSTEYTYHIDVKTPPLQSLCMVTVDPTSTYNVIVWEKTDEEATDSFYIYREMGSNVYQQIAAIHADSLSEYHDLSANPNITGYRYRIALKDTCYNYSLYPSEYHNSMHLQYIGSGNFQWNAYQIEGSVSPIVSYDILIDEQNNGNWQQLVTISGSQTTATDVAYAQHPNARYRVVANWAFTCVSSRTNYGTSFSNIINQQTVGLNDRDIERVSISLYSSNQIQVQTYGCKIIKCNLYNTTGGLMQSVTSVENQIEISALAQGMYIVELITDKGTFVKRVGKL